MEKIVIVVMEGVAYMKNIILALLVVALLFVPLAVYSGELDKPYTPTRKEWLELSIFKSIKVSTDAWRLRIKSSISAREEDGEVTINITMTASNGQDEPRPEVKQDYIDFIEQVVEGFLERYQWAKDFKVFVQFI